MDNLSFFFEYLKKISVNHVPLNLVCAFCVLRTWLRASCVYFMRASCVIHACFVLRVRVRV